MADKLRTMRIPEAMWEKIREAAKREDRTISSWVRAVLSHKMNTKKKQVDNIADREV